jgi:hypothetical protein
VGSGRWNGEFTRSRWRNFDVIGFLSLTLLLLLSSIINETHFTSFGRKNIDLWQAICTDKFQ